jgi:hypothetical protein
LTSPQRGGFGRQITHGIMECWKYGILGIKSGCESVFIPDLGRHIINQISFHQTQHFYPVKSFFTLHRGQHSIIPIFHGIRLWQSPSLHRPGPKDQVFNGRAMISLRQPSFVKWKMPFTAQIVDGCINSFDHGGQFYKLGENPAGKILGCILGPVHCI